MAASNSQRVPGKATLENLTRELYLNILGCLERDLDSKKQGHLSTLNNLSLASKTLHDVTIPSLYRSCTYRPIKKFLRTITKNRSLARHVQRLEFQLELDLTYQTETSPDIIFELISPLVKDEEFYLDLREALSIGDHEAKVVALILCCPYLKELNIDLRNHVSQGNGTDTYLYDGVPGAWWLGNLFHHVASQKGTGRGILHNLTTIRIRSQFNEKGEGIQQIALGKMIRNAARIPTIRRLEIDAIWIPNSATSGSTVFSSEMQELKIEGQFLRTDQAQHFFQSCKGLREFTLCLHHAWDFVGGYKGQPTKRLDLEALTQALHKHKNTLRYLCVLPVLPTNLLDTKTIGTLNTFDQITTLILDDKAFFSDRPPASGWRNKFHDTLPPNLQSFTLFTNEIAPMALEILGQLILADPPKSLFSFETIHEYSWSSCHYSKIVNVTIGNFIISQHECSVLTGTSFRVDRIDKLVGRLNNQFGSEKDFEVDERPFRLRDEFTDEEVFQRSKKVQ